MGFEAFEEQGSDIGVKDVFEVDRAVRLDEQAVVNCLTCGDVFAIETAVDLGADRAGIEPYEQVADVIAEGEDKRRENYVEDVFYGFKKKDAKKVTCLNEL